MTYRTDDPQRPHHSREANPGPARPRKGPRGTARVGGTLRRYGALTVPLALLLTACGGGSDPAEDSAAPDADDVAPDETPDEFTRETRIFNQGGDSPPAEVTVDAVEATEDSTLLHLSLTNLGETVTDGSSHTTTPFLFDPIEGAAYPWLTDGSSIDDTAFGSHADGGSVPFFGEVENEWRFYYPPLPDHVEYVTFFGLGAGAMTGIPVERVDEHRPVPEPGVDGDAPEREEPEPGDTLVWPVREPDASATEHIFPTEGYVTGDDATMTRSGDVETIALDADVLFEFDEAELTSDATELIEDAAASLDANAADTDGTVIVTGHTDGVGDDAYNQDLSEERADVVRAELEQHLSGSPEFDVSGVGSSEPVLDEGGVDDEEAREQNRRVELSYAARPVQSDDSADEDGIAAADRNVGAVGTYRDDASEPTATAEHGGFELAAYPLLRDGATVVAEVELTNNDDAAAHPDLGDDIRTSIGDSESLSGFRLVEEDGGTERFALLLVMEDDEREPFGEVAQEVAPGETYRLAVVFPAPEPDTDEITLSAGPFGDLTLPIE